MLLRCRRRRASFLFQLIVAIPLLWFSFIGFVVVMSGGDIGGPIPASRQRYAPRFRHNVDNVDNAEQQRMEQDLHIKQEQPVIERPEDIQLHFREEGVQHVPRREEEFDNRQQHEQQPRIAAADRVEPDEEANNQVAEPEVRLKTYTVNPNAPGENGKAVRIDKNSLSPEERAKYDRGWKDTAFNQYASDMISLHRSLPDPRDNECKSLNYRTKLPDTSVVIIFHNEAWSTLLRTVHSVLDRSPPQLIREVILVDDFSNVEHLKQPLDDFVASEAKVRLVRNAKREGLIRARLKGAAVAKGDILTFLDSHCECAIGWLEPLLDRIADNHSNVVTPVIDSLSDETLAYGYASARSTSVGGFDWNLSFTWHGIPLHERKRRKSPVDPIRSPTMAGGLFSIDKSYFEYLGTYDSGMEIWGGENLELSFRVWMCGGSLETIPCSHVGHIFRKHSPYKSPVNVGRKNNIRLAEVWMDEYKNYYHERFNYIMDEYGDISARKKLRQDLNCKSFDWFLKNIYPDLFIPGEALASGEIRSQYKPMCLDSPVSPGSMNRPLKTYPCHSQGGNQYWMLSKFNEIRRDDGCVDYTGKGVIVYGCHGAKGNQEWIYDADDTLRHVSSNSCLEISEDGHGLHMSPCTANERQIWQWRRKEQSKKDEQHLKLR